jgi:uncharacterized protein (TIGR02466 family)
MKNFFNDYLFPSFLMSGEVENLNNLSIVAECYEMREADEHGMKKSNVHGWHSKVIHTDQETPYENLNKLCDQAMEFGNFVAKVQNLNQVFKTIDWWVNINPENTYNAVHGHPKADLSIVYYTQVSENSGDLILMRGDGANHLDLFAKQPSGLRFNVRPQVGRMYAFPAHLLHYVQSNQSPTERISVAFNLTM